MTLFDIRELSLLSLCSNLLLVVTMALVGRIYAATPAIRLWSLGAVQAGAGFLLIALRHLVPELFSIVLANTLIATGFAWLLFGLRDALGLPRGPRWDIVAGALVVPSFAYFTFAAPDLGARIVIISVVLAALGLGAACLLLFSSAARRDADRAVLVGVGLAWLAFALVTLSRAALTAFAPPSGDFMLVTALIHKLAFVAILLLHVVLSLGLPYLVAARTERALRASRTRLGESESRLRLLIDHAPIALALFDRDMRYLALSRRWREYFEIGEREVIGHSHYDVFPALREEWKDAHRRGLVGEVVGSDGDTFERGDGRTIWCRWEVRPWHAADGGIGGIVIFAENVSERKAAEQALAAAQERKLQEQRQARLATLGMMEDALAARGAAEAATAALRDSAARDRALLDNLPQIIWQKDAESVYVTCNAAYARALGTTVEALAGKTDLDFYPAELAGKYRADDRRVLAGGVNETFEERWLLEGRERIVLTSKVPLRDREGRPCGTLGLAEDITARKAAEEELRQRNLELERFNRVTVGRELDIIEMKKTINALSRELGREPPYALDFLDEHERGRP